MAWTGTDSQCDVQNGEDRVGDGHDGNESDKQNGQKVDRDHPIGRCRSEHAPIECDAGRDGEDASGKEAADRNRA